MNNLDLKDKKVAVLGMGVEGISVAKFLSGKCHNITLLDQKSEEELVTNDELKGLLISGRFGKNFGPDYLNNLDDFDLVFRSPGIPFLQPKIQAAKKSGVSISSQIKLFFDLCPCTIVGVTGTKGKGTTASLIQSMMRKSQITNRKLQINSKNQTPNIQNESLISQNSSHISNVYLAGNIGTPAIDLIGQLKSQDIVVLELSSFQLQDLDRSPHIAVITNISVDHLDYHSTEDEYHEAKESIIKFQNSDDFAIINQDYLTAFEFAALTSGKVFFFSGKNSVDEGAYVRKSQITKQKSEINTQNSKLKTQKLYEVILRIDGKEEIICRSDEINLVGKHNLENVAAASIAAHLAGARVSEIRQGVREFKPLPHRLEFVTEIDGVKYYNDSFATNPEPTMAAIDSFDADKVLILGGSSKGADFSPLGKKIAGANVTAVILIGDEAKNIEKSLKENGYSGEILAVGHDFSLAILKTKEAAKSGSVVIFSPACASFDMFKNYKDRGDKFREMILKIQ